MHQQEWLYHDNGFFCLTKGANMKLKLQMKKRVVTPEQLI